MARIETCGPDCYEDNAMTILVTFPCGCAAYRNLEWGWITWGVRRCDTHFESGTLPQEAEKYFDVGREVVT